jgi:tight adherence protein B
VSPLLAGGAAALAVLAAADALRALHDADPLGALARLLAPARGAGRDGSAPGRSERRRLSLLGALVLAGAGALVAGPAGAVLAAALGPAAAFSAVRLRRRRWRRALAGDAPAACRALADALAGGAGLPGALATAARDGALGPAARGALGGLTAAIAAGAPLDAALRRLARRAGPGPWEALAAAVLLQRRSGGDLARLLRDLAATADAAAHAEAEAREASAQARLTARIVVALPLLGALLAEAAAPGTAARVLAAPLPALLAAGAVGLQAGALVVIGRIARVGDG